MNDDDRDPHVDPRDDESIRALLAELGTAPDASMPPEVAARLDETLAGLVAERSEGEGAASADDTVVPLRRRWAPRLAAAAAAVIVIGAGGVAAANLDLFDGGAGDSSSAKSSGGTAESLQDSSTSPAAPGSATGPVPTISAAGFDADVARLLRDGSLTSRDPRTQLSERQEGAPADSLRTAGCAGPRVTDAAQTRLVLYDGKPAVLLVHPPRGGERLVEAWTCAGDRVLDRVRVTVEQSDTGTGSGQSSPGSTGLASPSPSP
jgi:hypothetical protein